MEHFDGEKVPLQQVWTWQRERIKVAEEHQDGGLHPGSGGGWGGDHEGKYTLSLDSNQYISAIYVVFSHTLHLD